jgi:prepilin-type N-terminal cleavage/methylation domain-containing protein
MKTLSARKGYTLVELLVVIALIILLAAITVAVAQSGAFGSQRVVSATDRVSGWLLISKNRAIRDNAPRGVRFQLTPTTATRQNAVGHVQEMQYIEQPEIWVPNPTREPTGSMLAFATVTVPVPPMGSPTNPPGLAPGAVLEQWVYFIGKDADAINDFDRQVNVGDFLVLPEHASSYKITHILNPSNPSLSVPANPVVIAGGNPVALTYRPIELSLYGGAANLVGTSTGWPHVRQLLLVTMPYRGHLLPAPLDHYRAFQRPEPDLGSSGLPLTTDPPTNTFQPQTAFSAPFPRRGTKTTLDFGFQAAPRPLLGEPILTLTASTIIDVRAPLPITNPVTYAGLASNGYRDYGSPVGASINTGPFWPTTSTGFQINQDSLGQQYFDILFSPSGQVINNPNSLIALWVRDPEKVNHPRLGDAPLNNQLPTAAQWTSPLPTQLDRQNEFDTAGEQLLIVIYTKTGMIAAHPIVPPPAAPSQFYDPYKFAKDGANSGL